MIETILTTSNITFILGILAIIFSIFNYFKNPQVKLEQNEGLMTMAIKQLQLDLTNLRDNHVHTIDVKLDDQGKSIRDLSIQVAKLSTILEERLPKNKNL